MTGTIKRVIIVGAGPAGLLLAIRLAQANIKVDLFEATPVPSDQPRATHYGPPAVYELRRAGVLAEMRKDPECFRMGRMCWRKLDGTYIAGFDTTILGDYEDRTRVLMLNRVVAVMGRMVEKLDTVKVHYGRRVLAGAEQDAGKAWISVQNVETGEVTREEADYIVGCDGAASQVRRSLFGDMEFPGYTWDKQIVATNTYYDFSKFGWEDSNFIIHPEHLFMAARISENDQLWRVTYTEINGLTTEEIQARQAKKFETILPGNPKPDEYKVILTSPYRIHQRCAPAFRVGRYLLAADAAHLCNPFGGLGLTGGIVDVGGLADCLVGIHEGKTSNKILDEYSRVRIEKYKTIIDAISTENFKRLYDQDPEKVLENDGFLRMLKETAEDLEASKKIQLGSLAVLHDFTASFDGNKPSIPSPPIKAQKVDTTTVSVVPVVN